MLAPLRRPPTPDVRTTRAKHSKISSRSNDLQPRGLAHRFEHLDESRHFLIVRAAASISAAWETASVRQRAGLRSLPAADNARAVSPEPSLCFRSADESTAARLQSLSLRNDYWSRRRSCEHFPPHARCVWPRARVLPLNRDSCSALRAVRPGR